MVKSYVGDLKKIVRSARKRNSEAICSASHGREHCHPRHGSCFGSSDRRQLQNGDGWRSTGTIHVLQKALENSGQRSSNVASSPPVYTFYNTFMKHTTGTTGTVVLVHTCVQVHTGVRYMTYIIHTYIESILHTLHVHDMQQGCNFT